MEDSLLLTSGNGAE